jgi:hypothetical protein
VRLIEPLDGESGNIENHTGYTGIDGKAKRTACPVASSTAGLRTAALKCFSLERCGVPADSFDLPHPKRPKQLPTILTPDEGANNLLDWCRMRSSAREEP